MVAEIKKCPFCNSPSTPKRLGTGSIIDCEKCGQVSNTSKEIVADKKPRTRRKV